MMYSCRVCCPNSDDKMTKTTTTTIEPLVAYTKVHKLMCDKTCLQNLHKITKHYPDRLLKSQNSEMNKPKCLT